MNDSAAASGGTGEDRGKSTRRVLALAAGAAAVIGIAAAVVWYVSARAPLRATVLEVDGVSTRMGYFLKRVSFAAAEPTVVLQNLVYEQIIRQVAPQRPYAIEVTDEDVRQFLRERARVEGQAATESDFRSWYRRQLAETPFTDAEFRDLARNSLLREKLSAYLGARIPTVAAQVRLFMIAPATAEEALEAAKRLDAGEDFARLAREVNADEELRRQGGDIGWYPRAALPRVIADAAFDTLEVGRHSGPLAVNPQATVIIMVAERAPARQVEEPMRETLAANALEQWLQQELPNHRVAVYGLQGDWDAETEAWVRWQLQRMGQ